MANSVTIGSVIDAGAAKPYDTPGLVPKYWCNATATFDTNIAANVGAEFTVTVTGAALGDVVLIAPSGGDPEPNIFGYEAEVSAANTVSVCVHNNSAGADHPASVTGFNFAVYRLTL